MPKHFLEVTNKDRQCELFTKWRQGLTPKEHQEMIDREWMIKHQEEREDADKRWRRNQDWKLVIVAGIFTILGSLLAWLLTK